MKTSESNIINDVRKFHFYCNRCKTRTEHVKAGMSYECIECIECIECLEGIEHKETEQK